MLGIVKFFKADKGWGVLATAELPSDVWLHFSVIEADGFRAFDAGDVVEFDVEEAVQDSFSYRATRATLIRHGPAPTLRRIGGRVVIATADTPDTPLTPRRGSTTTRDAAAPRQQ